MYLLYCYIVMLYNLNRPVQIHRTRLDIMVNIHTVIPLNKLKQITEILFFSIFSTYSQFCNFWCNNEDT